MLVIETVAELKKLFGNLRTTGNLIGFSPTMGALHKACTAVWAGDVRLIDNMIYKQGNNDMPYTF